MCWGMTCFGGGQREENGEEEKRGITVVVLLLVVVLGGPELVPCEIYRRCRFLILLKPTTTKTPPRVSETERW